MKKSIFGRGLLCLVATLLITATQAQKKDPAPKKNPSLNENYINSDGNGSSGLHIVNYKEGQHVYKFNVQGDKITDLYIDDKKIPANEYSKYSDTINKILTQIKKDKEQAQLDMQRASTDKQQAKLDMERAMQDKMRAEQDMQQAKKDKETAELDQLKARKDQERAMLDKMKAEEDMKILNSLLSEIVSEKIVSTEDDISSMILNSSEFIVNGKKQSTSLQQKFKSKYLKEAGSEINYKRNANNRQFNIQKKGD